MMIFDSAHTSRAGSAVSGAGLTVASDTRLLKGSKPQGGIGRRVLSENFQPLLKEFFHKEPCPYTHQVFQYGALVFEALRHSYNKEERVHSRRGQQHEDTMAKNPQIPSIQFKSENEKRLTFQLVFQTLKCK